MYRDIGLGMTWELLELEDKVYHYVTFAACWPLIPLCRYLCCQHEGSTGLRSPPSLRMCRSVVLSGTILLTLKTRPVQSSTFTLCVIVYVRRWKSYRRKEKCRLQRKLPNVSIVQSTKRWVELSVICWELFSTQKEIFGEDDICLFYIPPFLRTRGAVSIFTRTYIFFLNTLRFKCMCSTCTVYIASIPANPMHAKVIQVKRTVTVKKVKKGKTS